MTSTGIAGESDVKLAFEKALALAKVYYNCTNKAYETAVKEGDAHSAKFFKCCLEEVVRCPVMLYLCSLVSCCNTSQSYANPYFQGAACCHPRIDACG